MTHQPLNAPPSAREPGFQRNAWYVAALPGEVGRSLMRRVILEQPVALFRREDGSVAAIGDTCPHRFAPLSKGVLHGDVVECPYHGLRFAADGSCALNPHGPIVPNLRVRAYPVVERHSLVWIWMGDPALAQASAIPDLSYIDAHEIRRTVFAYIPARFRYDILVDNLLDISHADYLHVGSFSSGPPQAARTEVVDEGNSVLVVRTQQGSPAPRAFPGFDTVDMEFRIRWHPGQVIDFELRAAPSGQPLADVRPRRFAHFITPQSHDATHYFISQSRESDLDSAEVDRAQSDGQRGLIEREDIPMLEAIHAQMDGAGLIALRPVILPIDKGAMIVRRKMQRLIANETEQAA